MEIEEGSILLGNRSVSHSRPDHGQCVIVWEYNGEVWSTVHNVDTNETYLNNDADEWEHDPYIIETALKYNAIFIF